MIKISKILFIFLFNLNYLYAFDGYLKVQTENSDKEWDFLPSIPASFDHSTKNSLELFALYENFGLLINHAEFKLDLVRASEPRFVNLTSENNKLEFFYLLNNSVAVSIGYELQDARKQLIECYSFGGFVIGSCLDYDLKLTNSNPKYDSLNENLIMIDGETESISLSISKASSFILFDQYKFGIEFIDHNFDWLTPLESITSGLIYNLKTNGATLGEYIDTTLSNLPQRDPWNTYQLNLGAKKSFSLNNYLNIFYDLQLRYFELENYSEKVNLPSVNYSIKSGLEINIGDLRTSFYGIFYESNLLGFEPIVFNQRTESYFNKNFGMLGIELEYFF